MRIIWRLLLLIALLGGVYFYFFGGKVENVKSALEDVTASNAPITVYRWRDSSGNWAYGPTPPPGVKYEARTIDPNASAAPMLPIDKKKEEDSLLSPERIRSLFEQASQLGKPASGAKTPEQKQ